MKDGLFEMLMSFFEKSLSELKEKHPQNTVGSMLNGASDSTDARQNNILMVKSARDSAHRVFTEEERSRFTRPGFQFLMQMMLWRVIAPKTLEQIMNNLLFSDSRFITLQETKWTIRNILAEHLTQPQIAFLDLVLYQKEDALLPH